MDHRRHFRKFSVTLMRSYGLRFSFCSAGMKRFLTGFLLSCICDLLRGDGERKHFKQHVWRNMNHRTSVRIQWSDWSSGVTVTGWKTSFAYFKGTEAGRGRVRVFRGGGRVKSHMSSDNNAVQGGGSCWPGSVLWINSSSLTAPFKRLPRSTLCKCKWYSAEKKQVLVTSSETKGGCLQQPLIFRPNHWRSASYLTFEIWPRSFLEMRIHVSCSQLHEDGEQVFKDPLSWQPHSMLLIHNIWG